MSELALQLIAENKKTKNPFLDLGDCGLKNYLPNELLDCIWLERLNLGIEYYDVSKEEWEKSFNQKGENSFVGNELIVLGKLQNLTTLYLSHNQITDIRFLEKLPNLNSLDLSSNQITDIRSLEKLPNLNSLDLSKNKLTYVRFLENLVNLNSLDLSYNKIIYVKFLENLTNLKSLNLSYNQITDFRFLENLINIKSLNLRNNRLTDIRFLANFRSLKSLNLHGNELKDINVLLNLPNLDSLDLSLNQITDFSVLSNLQNLKSLNLNSNQITDFRFLENLINLNSLDLRNNQITDIRFLENLVNLNSLNLRYNKIIYINFLENLVNLNSLGLRDNELTDIHFLENLVNLNSLDLCNNQLRDIRFLKNLVNLNSLDLRNNQITDISFLENLTKLNSLDLRDNQITDITPILPLYQKGIDISLLNNNFFHPKISPYNNNPITTPPMHIVRQGKEAILRYFSAGKLKPLNECKLIFVGDGEVGKTCLMKRIVYDTFDENEKQTHGINKIAWEEIRNINGEKVRVNFWDFGGQDIQHSLHQFFFTERVIYVLVLNPRNDDKAAYWLEQIDKLGADSEVLVVYNWRDKTDLQASFMSKFYELRKKYSKLPEPFVLSVKTDEGIDDFREKVKKAILQNEGLVQEYPEKWFNIKQKLEETVSIKEYVTSYETYEKWCNEFDYKDEDDQKALLVTLNNIGSIVFFDENNLKNLQVLNPEWITTGAYAILTSKLTKDKNGHLTITDLKEIFKDGIEIFSNKEIKIKYKEHHFQYIIHLMLFYNLCQENPFKKHEYLIPAAFGAKPHNNYDSHKQDARNYRIQFDSPFEMLIIHRFIAKNLSKVQGKDYWQSGIFIKDNSSNTFALVETNLHSSRIDFWIKGDNIRGFWEAMRRDFRDIFIIYKKFSYREEVLYKHENGEVFLPYHEMLNCLKNKVRIIAYHPTYEISNIDVSAVLDLFEDAKTTEINIRKEMEQKGDITINTGGGDFINHGQFAVKKSKQKIINNIESSKLNEFNEIKEILLELQKANVNNELWKDTLVECLDEFTKLEEVEEKDKPVTISSIDKTFSFLEKIKKGMDSIIPVTVIENLPKLIDLWNKFKVNF